MIRRLLAPVCLFGALLAPATLLAQEEVAPVAEDSGGSPIYGYLAFGALGGLTLAIICRSSRRS